MRKLSRVALVLAILGLSIIVPTVAATDNWFFPDAGSQTQREWQTLFTQVFWVSLAVFVLVEGLLLYALIRFRRRPNGPQEGPHIHGNTKMEIAWTIAPTIILAWLLVVSLQQLDRIDNGPQPDFTVDVVGHQFYFEFFYPPDYAQSTRNKLFVEEDKVVGLRVTSTDVIHAFNVPELGVMIDAVPGKTNYFWFKADGPGEYKFQCRELCGVGHGAMNGSVVVAAAGANPRPFGEAEPPATTNATTPDSAPTNASAPQGDSTQVVTLSEFAIGPKDHEVTAGETLVLDIRNDGRLAHNLFIGNPDGTIKWQSEDFEGGEQGFLVVELPPAPGKWEWWCNIPGHKASGMEGTLSTGGDFEGEGKQPILPGPSPLLIVLVLVGTVLIVRAARRD
ncbi:MAG TPA: cytochrome c oxidase subunit II [Candidatus Thermoplasmatota archaeon]